MAMHAKGKMKKKGMARGGMKMKKKGMARGGAKMPMAKDPKSGKMIPAFAMDGKGKMAKGGMTKKKKTYTVEQCGLGCPSQHWLVTHLTSNGRKSYHHT